MRSGSAGAAARAVAVLASLAIVRSAAFSPSASAQEPPKRGERWSEVETADVRVLAQAPPRRTEDVALALVLARAAVLAISGVAEHQAPFSTTVVVFRDDQALAAYHREPDGSPPPDPLLRALDRQGRLLAFSLEAAERELPRAREVLARDVVDQLVADPPAWLRTGLGALASRFEPGPSPAGASVVERLSDAPESQVRAPTTDWPPAAALDAAAGDAPVGIAVELVRHLAHPRSERSSQLRRFVALLRGGMPSETAFEECFFAPFAAVYDEVRAAAERGGAPAIALDVEAPPLAAHEAEHAEVLLALGDLLLRAAPWNTVGAELHLRGVLAARPEDPAALRGIARARELDGRTEDAAAAWERALAAAPAADTLTPTLYGWSRLQGFRRSTGARRGWEDPIPREVLVARELFARALSGAAGEGGVGARTPSPLPRAPGPVHALHGWGATFLYAGDDLEPGLEALERASALYPGDHEISADLAVASAHAGDQERGWELWRRRLRDDAPPALAAEIERLLAEETLHAADRLLREERPGEAMDLLRAAAAEIRDPATRSQIEDFVRQIEKIADQLVRDLLSDRFLVAYDRARRLAGERRFDEARALLEPFAGQEVDPVVRDQARELLEQLDRVDPDGAAEP